MCSTMSWQIILILGCILVEALIIVTHTMLKKVNAKMTLFVAMGAKILKIVLAALSIFLVYRFTEIPILSFCIWLAACYIVALVIETYILLKK